MQFHTKDVIFFLFLGLRYSFSCPDGYQGMSRKLFNDDNDDDKAPPQYPFGLRTFIFI